MNLNKIYYAIEVSKAGSISKAAENLYTSQPAISMAINDLEEELGFKIFQRSNTGTKTTVKGLEYLVKCNELINKYKDLQRQYSVDKNDITELRISSQHFNFIVSAFIKLTRRHEDSPFKFYLKETTSLSAINDVENDYSDLAFIYINESYRQAILDLFKEKHLTYVSIAEVIPHVFMNDKHPLASERLITISDLYDYPMVIYEQDDTQILPEEFVRLPDHPQVIYTQDRGTTLGIISSTNSFNIGTGCLHPSNGFPNIKAVKLENPENLYMDIGYVYKSSKNLSILCKEYLDLTKLELLQCLPSY